MVRTRNGIVSASSWRIANDCVEMRNDIEPKGKWHRWNEPSTAIITESNRMATIEFQNVNMLRRILNANVRQTVSPCASISVSFNHHDTIALWHNIVCSVNKSLLKCTHNNDGEAVGEEEDAEQQKKLYGRQNTLHRENIRHAHTKTALTSFNSFFMMWSASTLSTMDTSTVRKRKIPPGQPNDIQQPQRQQQQSTSDFTISQQQQRQRHQKSLATKMVRHNNINK